MNILSISILCLGSYILGSSIRLYRMNRSLGVGRLKSLIHVEKKYKKNKIHKLSKREGADIVINTSWLESVDPGIKTKKWKKEVTRELKKIELQQDHLKEQDQTALINQERNIALINYDNEPKIFEIGSNKKNPAIAQVRETINSFIIINQNDNDKLIVLGEMLGELNNMKANSDIIGTFESLIFRLNNPDSNIRKDTKEEIAQKFEEHIKYLKENKK